MSYKRLIPFEKIYLALGSVRCRRAILRGLGWGLGGLFLLLDLSGCSWSYFHMSPRHQKYPITPPELKIEKFVLGFDGHVKEFENNNYLSVTFASELSQGKMKKYFLEELESAGLMVNTTGGGFELVCNYREIEGEYFGGGLESFLGKTRITLKLECCMEALKWCDTLTSVGVGVWHDAPGLQRARARANEGLLRQLVPLLAEELERSVASGKAPSLKKNLLDTYQVAPVGGEL